MADINLGVGGANSAVGGYDIDNSVKLQTAGVNSEFFNYTIGTTGNRTKGTVSMWIKRTSFGTTQCLWEQGNTNNESGRLFVRFDTNDTLRIATGSTVLRVTNRVFRDASAWYHIVVAIDTTSVTADNRTRLYVNGVEETSFSTKNNFSQNDSTGMNFEKQHIGLFTVDESSFASFNGYMAEVFGADGLVYAASDFGEFDSSGIWKPKDLSAISSSVGTNGFYMKFENAASMGANSAGSGHGFSVQNINQNDQATDTPTNNFCIYNPVADFRQRDLTGFKNGGTQITHTDEGQWCGGICTMGVTRGKWYWEIQQYDIDNILFGVHTFTGNVGSNTNPQSIDNSWYYYGGGASGSFWGNYINGTGTSNSANRGTVWSAGNIIGFALNLDDDEFTFYVNGGSAGASNTNVDISSLTALGLPLIPFIGMWRSSVNLNFGGFTMTSISSGNTDANGYGNFEYAPPSGYYALCTKNLAEFG